MRRIVAALGIVVAAAAAATASVFQLGDSTDEPLALPGSAMPGRLVIGFQDDASLRWAEDRADALDEAEAAGAMLIRTIVAWEAAAQRRPVDAADPFDPAYALDDLDDLARSAQQRGIELLVTIWGTPAWANGGLTPNHAPDDPHDLEAFAHALADRYSGRHPGFPAIRLFSAWNEPNLEQFLAPQFDDAGRSVSAELYAPLARAIHDGVKAANPDALVAIGETSPRGHDRPSRGTVQDSHSPARFARLLSEVRPRVPFDAWAQHPYPRRPDVAPGQAVRWPRIGLANLEQFAESLETWFGRDEIPLWITEYGHETRPGEPLGVSGSVQARFVDESLALAAGNPRVRVFVWFILRDRVGEPWQSGLISEDGSPKPALVSFRRAAKRLDARNPVLPPDADVAHVPVLELAFRNAVDTPIEVSLDDGNPFAVLLGADGWLEVPLARRTDVVVLQATDPHGNRVERVLGVSSRSLELD